jgi:hypothetical protein
MPKTESYVELARFLEQPVFEIPGTKFTNRQVLTALYNEEQDYRFGGMFASIFGQAAARFFVGTPHFMSILVTERLLAPFKYRGEQTVDDIDLAVFNALKRLMAEGLVHGEWNEEEQNYYFSTSALAPSFVNYGSEKVTDAEVAPEKLTELTPSELAAETEQGTFGQTKAPCFPHSEV